MKTDCTFIDYNELKDFCRIVFQELKNVQLTAGYHAQYCRAVKKIQGT